MSGFKDFLKRKNIVISGRRYGVDALGAMAQGLFASLLIGTILNTIGKQIGIAALTFAIWMLVGRIPSALLLSFHTFRTLTLLVTG